MDHGSVEYFKRREQAEWAAASTASSSEARAVHEDLAQRYADRAEAGEIKVKVDAPTPRARLIIVAGSNSQPYG